MWERLEEIEREYDVLSAKIADPEVLADQAQWQALVREHAWMQDVVTALNAYRTLEEEAQAVAAMLTETEDSDEREWLESELEGHKAELEKREGELRRMLLPPDEEDERGVVLEIRAGAGGEEAALFAADLFRMYSRYAENNRWRVEVLSAHETGIGGFKEIIVGLEGKGAYSRLKFESGVHRVQRIPTTESGGRIHTSTATVAVLPEAEEVDLEIRPEELQIDTYRAGGAGGQHVNKTESAIRITHLPTGMVVTCQDERSQHKNRAKAMKVLMARLYERKLAEQSAELASERKTQVGSGDRSERIRTYNFPDGRVSDHRIGLTLYKLESILEGEIDALIDPMIEAHQEARLAEMERS